MSLKIIWGDIVKEKTDALVTLASREPRVGSGVDKAVHNAAGPELLRARLDKAKQMGPGIATFTPSFGLKKTCGAKNVIHIAGVLWEGGGHDEPILLDAAYLKAMAIANALGAEIVTLPVMGAGKYGMPKTLALDQAVKSLKECLRYFPDIQIKLVTVEAEIYDYAKSKYADLCESHFSAEEEDEYRKKFPVPKKHVIEDCGMLWRHSGNETEYWRNYKLRHFEQMGDFTATLKSVWRKIRDFDRELVANAFKEFNEDVAENGEDTGKGREDIVEQNVAQKIGRIPIYSRNILAERAGIKERKLKAILAGTTPCPSRDVVLALSVDLALPTAYARVMMKKCGYVFMSDVEESIYSECIQKGTNSIFDLNEKLIRRLGKKRELKPDDRKPSLKDRRRKEIECKPKKVKCKNRRR